MSSMTLISMRRKRRDPTASDIGAIVLEIAEQIVGDDKDVAAVLEWAAEKFGRASEDDETAEQLRFALRVVISDMRQGHDRRRVRRARSYTSQSRTPRGAGRRRRRADCCAPRQPRHPPPRRTPCSLLGQRESQRSVLLSEQADPAHDLGQLGGCGWKTGA